MFSSLSPRNRQTPASQGLGWVGTNSSLCTRLGCVTLSSSGACAVSASLLPSNLFAWKVSPQPRGVCSASYSVSPWWAQLTSLPACSSACANRLLQVHVSSAGHSRLASHHCCFTPALGSTASCISILLKEWPLWLPQVLSSSRWTWLFLTQSNNSGKWEAWPLRWMERNQYALSTPLNVGVSGHVFPSCPGFPFCSMSERRLLCHSQKPDFESNSGWIKSSCFPELPWLCNPWGNLCLSMVTLHGVIRVIQIPSRARLNMIRSNSSDHHVPPTWPLN